MHHLIALLAGCLLHPPANDPCKEARAAQYQFLKDRSAAQVRWNDNGTVHQLTGPTRIFFPGGAAGFKVDQPAPQVLEKLGPALLARGTEELRVRHITLHSELPARMPNRRTVIRLVEYLRGREVHQSAVNLALDPQTNEVTLLVAVFLPDRGLSHEPRLNEAQARAKLEVLIRQSPHDAMNYLPMQEPGRLAYKFEEMGSFGGSGGALVWLFPVATSSPENGEGHFGELSIDAVTGEILPRHSVLTYWDR